MPDEQQAACDSAARGDGIAVEHEDLPVGPDLDRLGGGPERSLRGIAEVTDHASHTGDSVDLEQGAALARRAVVGQPAERARSRITIDDPGRHHL